MKCVSFRITLKSCEKEQRTRESPSSQKSPPPTPLFFFFSFSFPFLQCSAWKWIRDQTVQSSGYITELQSSHRRRSKLKHSSRFKEEEGKKRKKICLRFRWKGAQKPKNSLALWKKKTDAVKWRRMLVQYTVSYSAIFQNSFRFFCFFLTPHHFFFHPVSLRDLCWRTLCYSTFLPESSWKLYFLRLRSLSYAAGKTEILSGFLDEDLFTFFPG